MTADERIRFLMRAASRAEGEGNERIARLFRRMAEEARPLEVHAMLKPLRPSLESCFD